MHKILKYLPGGGMRSSSGGGSSNTSGGLNPAPWAIVGGAADAIGGFMPLPSEYSGDKGAVTSAMDTAYNKISDVAMAIPGIGTAIGGAMKGAALLGKGLGALGGGTDGETTTDAVLGSSLFNWNIGLINGFGGSKTDTMSKDYATLAAVGSSYGGTYGDINDAVAHSGKKYGLFSKKARDLENEAIHEAGRLLNRLKTIALNQQLTLQVMANQSNIAATNYANQLSGGYDLAAMRAAKHGMKFRKEELFGKDKLDKTITVLTKKKQGGTVEITPFVFNLDAFKEKSLKDAVQEFKEGGSIGETNVIPEGALHAHKHHMEDLAPELDGQITKKGIPVVVDGKKDGEVELQAEIERNEIILRKSLTELVEKAYKEYYKDDTSLEKKDELAITIGKLLSEEIINNTEDRTGLLKTVE